MEGNAYGAKLDAKDIMGLLTHVFNRNNDLNEKGVRGTPICIWGPHGIGKTQMVQTFAREKNWQFAYCAPAQFEEMGDFHGLPEIVDPDPTVTGNEYTVFRAPDWAPRENGPGILLLDDLNRADDRILRGLMQLLQNFELFSWQLPDMWQIVATANPEEGDYSVTPMDDSMLTRMLHATMYFEPKVWAEWAVRSGVDQRGITFVLTYPETVTGIRTNPRTLTQFFEQIKGISDLKRNSELVFQLASSALDETTVASFISFINDDLQVLVNPEEILNSNKFELIVKRVKELSGTKKYPRFDRIAAMTTRLYLTLTQEGYKPKKKHADNLVQFLLIEEIPNDLRLSFHQDIIREGSKDVKSMLTDKRLAKLILEGI